MELIRCERCNAEHDAGENFCTRCGYDLKPAPPSQSRPTPPSEVRLVACPACGATNAASRRWCGRCRVDLRAVTGEGATVTAPPSALSSPPAGLSDAITQSHEVAPDSGVPALFIVAVTLAALAIVGVLLTILSARGIGLFAGPPEPTGPPEPVALAVRGVDASSALPPSGDVTYEAANLVDDDLETAWVEGASGAGDGEWFEVLLAQPAPISRIVVWNGYQKGEQFRDNARLSRVRIDVGDRTFDADLLDILGPQAVDLPETVVADRARITIVEVYPGERYDDAAVSRVELRGPPDVERGDAGES